MIKLRLKGPYSLCMRGSLNKKGIALYLVLSMLLVVVAFGGVILSIILTHSRITNHQIVRIQAYYAAQAGMNYALEQLRGGGWTYIPSIANSCPDPNGCTFCASSCTVTEQSFPPNIQQVKVIFCPSGTVCLSVPTACTPPAGNTFCVNITTTYQTPSAGAGF